ncbi:hypothetical protein CI1B_25440 [Bradyrhizobium ivorense]|uniref:Uncharacterized protein n=1 Tax=Bradyrhizobium ivorense TaxID=2511166 RepID=A0A508T1D0_9BRAD|nr:hypothetical protein CI1B_25440 [Bradyrhizobium ivorense]
MRETFSQGRSDLHSLNPSDVSFSKANAPSMSVRMSGQRRLLPNATDVGNQPP